jgi:hypothetical protein
MTSGTFLAKKKVLDLIRELKPQSDLVDVPSDATLEYVFEVLLANDILSVPVYKAESQPKEYLGFVTVQDMVHHLFESVSQRWEIFSQMWRKEISTTHFIAYAGKPAFTTRFSSGSCIERTGKGTVCFQANAVRESDRRPRGAGEDAVA